LSSADCKDIAYASLVYVAPDTPLIRALWAESTWERSIGITWDAMLPEYESATWMSGTDTAVILLLLTVTLTANLPYPYCSSAPVALRDPADALEVDPDGSDEPLGERPPCVFGVVRPPAAACDASRDLSVVERLE
jgi:hypothetical protein